MFTGLVQESATVAAWAPESRSARLTLETRLPGAGAWALGASIALNGVCLTVVKNEIAASVLNKQKILNGGEIRHVDFEISPETLARTNLGELRVGHRVHVEPALSLGDPLGGHLVSGHVDGRGQLSRLEDVQEYRLLEFAIFDEARARVAPFLVEKGSIAVDGVSLTVNGVRDEAARTLFQVMLIPHTLTLTRFGEMGVGAWVNLEADMLAKYVCRNLEFRSLKNV